VIEGQHGFRTGYSHGSQVIMVCQGISGSMDNRGIIDTIIIDFSKAFDLVPHYRLLMKTGLKSSSKRNNKLNGL
jgi:hypothetical protein